MGISGVCAKQCQIGVTQNQNSIYTLSKSILLTLYVYMYEDTYWDCFSFLEVSSQLLDAAGEGPTVLHVGHTTADHAVTRLNHLHEYGSILVNQEDNELMVDIGYIIDRNNPSSLNHCTTDSFWPMGEQNEYVISGNIIPILCQG